jgi:hypothetical protein
MPSHEENPHEELDEILRDVAEECIPEVRASDEYEEAWAERSGCAERFHAALTESQWRIFMEFEEEDNYTSLLEEIAMFRKIFFYGLAQGIRIGRRSKNGRSKRTANI